ncbi:MAG: hypothetical protein AAFQ89_01725 [Cyanobacteria bacterium J06626_18]
MQYKKMMLSLFIFVGLVISSNYAIADSSSDTLTAQTSPESPDTGTSPTQPAPQASDDPALLRALIEHLAGINMPNDELIVGGMPDSLTPDLLPIPSDTRVLGSIVRGGDYVDVVLDSAQPPERITAFYEEHLLSTGWQPAQFSADIWNFTTPEFAGAGSEYGANFFCSPNEELTLYLTAYADQPDQPTSISIGIYNADVGVLPPACNTNAANALPPLPTLQLPEGVNRSSSNAGLGEDFRSFHTDTIIETDMGSEAVLSHLADQFEQAEWTLIDRADEEGQSSASWTFESTSGQTWQGTLNVIKLQGAADEYLLRAEAEIQ